TIINDLKTGICDPKRIVLLVVDEAHRATGSYAYVEVVKFIKRFNQSFRILALTATPGSAVESVQEVIDGLDIARVEIRTESSLDIRQYVHSRKIETVLFDYSMEQEMCMDLFSKALQSSVNRLRQHNAYWSADPMSLTAYGLTQARQRWMASDAGRNAHWGVKGPVNLLFTMLASLAHSIELLKYHGIAPFYHGLLAFRNGVDEGGGKSKQRQAVNQDENFEKLMVRLRGWINDPDFIGHPKLEYLRSVVLNHFMDAGEGRAADGAPPSSTRIMIFAHYRDSAEEIVRVLKRNEPMIRPHVFVGQASSKGSEGMDQKRQLEVIQKFKAGVYNTLVATSIGEEGLDIGEIDLIICYDSSASPIRMLQRMGRTGRKRAGNIVLLLMKGKEEKSFESARDNYEKMQAMIASGTRFNFHDDRSPRIVPKEIQPVVDKREVKIPLENTQANMPEPKRRGRAPKRPPKKFHMPDGVRTGFVRASRIDDEDDGASDDGPTRVKRSKKQLLIAPPIVEKEPLPSLEEVLLNKLQERELERKYQHVYDGDGAQTVTGPRLGAFPLQLQKLGQTRYVKHGRTTTQTAKMLARVHRMDKASADRLGQTLHMSDVETDQSPEHASDYGEELEQATPSSVRRPRRKRSDFAAAMEAPTSSAPKIPACMQLPTQGIDLGSDASGNDQEESADSELDDFVVDDAAPVVPLTSSISASAPITQKFYVSQERRQSSVSEDDLPEITTLVQTRNVDPEFGQTNRKVLDRVEILSSPPVVRQTMKKRRVVEESDSE
ncbi:ATP-dependent DNA helicase mph1, partial [Cryomyces minteri]